MGAGANAAIVIVVLLLFFLPIIPYTFQSSSNILSSSKVTGTVSVTYYIFHCGLAANVQGTSTAFGGLVSSSVQAGTHFLCSS